MNNKKGVKLLAVVAAFAMMIAGAFIIIDNVDETNATTTATLPNGNITGDLEYVTSTTITDNINLSTTSSDVVTVTITYNVTAANTPMISGTIQVGNNVKLVLNMVSESDIHCNMLTSNSITITGNGEIVIKESNTIAGQSWWGSSHTLTMSDSSKFTLDGANGFSGVNATLSDSSSIVAKNNQNKSSMTFSSMNIASGASITIADGDSQKMFMSIYNGTHTVAGTIDAGNSVIKVMESTSITATGGKISASQIIPYNYQTPQNLTLGITGGTITAKFDNNSGNTIAPTFGGTTFTKTSAIGTGVNATFDGAIIGENATLNVSGTVSGSVTNNGTVGVMTTGTGVAGLTFDPAGTGSVNTDAISDDAYLGGVINSTSTNTSFGEGQVVHVVDDIIIKNNALVIIKGVLDIPEGKTITIEDGGQLIVYGSTAIINNNGTIISESNKSTSGIESLVVGDTYYGGLCVVNATVENKGSIIAAYEGSQTSDSIVFDGKLINEGTVSVEDYSKNYIKISKLAVNKGTINIDGKIILAANIENYSEIIINGTVDTYGDSTKIAQASVDATVSIVSLNCPNASGNLKGYLLIDDSAITAGNNRSFKNTANSIKLTPGNPDYSFSGLLIESRISTEKNGTDTNYYRDLVISGSIENKYTGNDTAGDVKILTELNGTRIYVDDELTIGKNSLMQITAGAVLHVSGTMNVYNGAFSTSSATATLPASTGNAGTIDVTGTVVADTTAIIGKLNAASYKVSTTNPVSTTYYYTTLNKAIESGATAITVTGVISVDGKIAIPSGTTVTQDATNWGSTMTMTIKEKSEVTVEDGAALIQKGSDASIDVKGTLYVQAKKTGIKTVSTTSIISDVVSEGTNDVRYTNLASAIINAGSSDVVIKLSNNVTVSSDMTIPSNVIINMDGKTFTVSGAKLTIDGALFIGNNNANFSIADVTEPLLKKASVVVNGMIASTDNIAYDGAKFPAGAYYSVKYQNVNYNVITSAVNAPEVINDAQDQTVGLYGTNKVSDLDFEGTDKPVYILVKGDLTAGTISIDNAYVIFDNGKKVTATISNGEDSFSLKDVLINANNTTFGSYDDDDDVYHFSVTGSFNVQSGKDSTYGFIVKGDVEIAGATFTAITDSKYYSIIVDGTAVVTASSTLGDALVNGALIINNGVNASATDVTVNGSIEAKIATEESPSEGSLSISGKLYAGLTAAGTTGAVPTITGNVTATTSYVINGTTVPNSIAKATGVKTTAYVVEGVSWMTVYTTDSTLTIASVSKAPVENAILDGWIGEDGKTKATTEKVGAEGFTTVTAKINYYIYNVVIVGDAGIGSISIDGVVLVKGGTSGENLFVLPEGTYLKAGEHKVTYVLKDGYEGTPVLYKDGTSTGGVTFSVSGKTTVGSPEYYTLSGTTAIEITPIQPTEKEDTGMGITDYLLIVLVILAAILVVVVAIRMMRS